MLFPVPYQSIPFDLFNDNPCGCADNEFVQLVDQDDKRFIQFTVEPCDSDISTQFELITNDWNDSAGDNTICTSNAGIQADGSATMESLVVLDSQLIVYQFEILSVDEPGSLVVSVAGSNSYTLSNIGIYTLYFYSAIPFGIVDLTVSTNDGFSGCFKWTNQIQALNINYRLGIIDSSNEFVALLNAPTLTSGNYLTFIADFTDLDLPNGCYRFAVIDGCENECSQLGLFNQSFASTSGWTSSSPFLTIQPSSNAIRYLDNTGGIVGSQIESISKPCIGKQYQIRYSLNIIAGSPLVQPNFGNVGGVIRSASGNYVEFITPTNEDEFKFLFQTTTSVAQQATITNFSVSLVDVEDYIPSMPSQTFNLGDWRECTFLLEGCNASNGFGYDFENVPLVVALRVEARLFRSQNETSGRIYRGVSGRVYTRFWDMRKKKTLRIERSPEYIHDFLSIWIGLDRIYVNAVQYAPAEENYPEIEYTDIDDLGSVDIELYLRNQLSRKSVCTSAEASCLPTIFDGAKQFQDGNKVLFQDGESYEFNDYF
jgi:hypothetical protein